ncbi:MAG TPA: chorismate lyase [Pseudomonadales bacterium]|nr:chorismate lyase [Pseudomonadales bacterium]
MSRLHSQASPLRNWLLDRGSLTRRLQKKSGGHFSVKVLKQRWEKPKLDEARALNISPDQLALVREVILYGCDQPWVYARSVLPQQVLNGRLRFLRRLGNKPLGALLFSNPSIRREPVVVQCYAPSRLPPLLQKPSQQPLWGRYSIFRYGRGGILVSEIFLPAFVDSVMLSP